MFSFFKKKKKTDETDEMSANDIIIGINAVRKRTKIDRHYVIFLNACVSKRTCRKLKRKKYNVEILNSYECPAFKVSW